MLASFSGVGEEDSFIGVELVTLSSKQQYCQSKKDNFHLSWIFLPHYQLLEFTIFPLQESGIAAQSYCFLYRKEKVYLTLQDGIYTLSDLEFYCIHNYIQVKI